MPGQSKIQKKPFKKFQELDRMVKKFNHPLSHLGGPSASSPRDPQAKRRRPLGTADPKNFNNPKGHLPFKKGKGNRLKLGRGA